MWFLKWRYLFKRLFLKKSSLSELNVMCVCKLKFFSNVLSPSWIYFDLICQQRSSEEGVPEVRSSNWSSSMESFHSALTSFHIFSVKLQLFVNWVYCSGVSFHIKNRKNPDQNKTGDHCLWHGREVLNKSPISITGRIFYESEKIFESSLFVGSVNSLFAEPVFFELPIILFSDRSK